MKLEDALALARVGKDDVAPEIAWAVSRKTATHRVRITRAVIYHLSLNAEYTSLRPYFLELADCAFDHAIFGSDVKKAPAGNKQLWMQASEESSGWLRSVASATINKATKIIQEQRDGEDTKATHRDKAVEVDPPRRVGPG